MLLPLTSSYHSQSQKKADPKQDKVEHWATVKQSRRQYEETRRKYKGARALDRFEDYFIDSIAVILPVKPLLIYHFQFKNIQDGATINMLTI